MNRQVCSHFYEKMEVVADMARKSKYDVKNSADKESLKWKAGLYSRLSREDGDKEESDSIGNQKNILADFVSVELDIEQIDFYEDDGFSGTHFNRPGFMRMIEDIKCGRINCVIVKDLSRLGRNYIEVGKYIETFFPVMKVRFISINDTLDSVKNPSSMNNLIVPFKNIINDEYCRDISNKVRSSLNMKRKQGKFIGSFATYGYQKDPQDHNHLLIDPEAAEVVQLIYQWFLEGMSIMGIAKRLNEQGILNPTAYKQSQGQKYHHPSGKKNDKMWPDTSVRRVLSKEVYTGTLVQGVNRIKSYKLQMVEAVPKEEWIVVEDTHEAIIDKETFWKVQSMLQRDTRTAPRKSEVYLFSGFLKCADCGRAMNRKKITQSYGIYCYYICSTYKKMNKSACSKHTIRSEILEGAVLTTIQQQIQIAVSMDEVISAMNEKGKTKKGSLRLEKALAEKKEEKKKVEAMMLALYPDWKNGDISKEEYQIYKEQFAREIVFIEEHIRNLQEEITSIQNGIDSSNGFIAKFIKFKNIQSLTREVLVELVENIYIHEGGGITIQFHFQDEYEKAVEYIENNQKRKQTA